MTLTIDEARDLYLDHLAHERRVAALTVEAYGRDLAELGAYCAERALVDVAALEPLVLRAFLAARFGELAPASVARRLAALRGFGAFLERRGFLPRNPAGALKGPKQRRELPHVVTVDEAFALIEHDQSDETPTRLRDRAIVELLYGSGLRVSEVTGLDDAAVDLAAGTARVLGKGGKERLVPLGQATVAALRAWLAARPAILRRRQGALAAGALFVNRDGTRLSARGVERIVRQRGLAAGTREAVHPHLLRHTCATHLLEAGADLRVIQELLGHASLSTTQRYTHLDAQGLAKVYDQAHPLACREPAAPDAPSTVGEEP